MFCVCRRRIYWHRECEIDRSQTCVLLNSVRRTEVCARSSSSQRRASKKGGPDARLEDVYLLGEELRRKKKGPQLRDLEHCRCAETPFLFADFFFFFFLCVESRIPRSRSPPCLAEFQLKTFHREATASRGLSNRCSGEAYILYAFVEFP